MQNALGHAAKTIIHDYGDSSSIMVVVFFVPKRELFPNKWTPNPFVAVVATNNAFKAQRAGSALTSHLCTLRGTKPASYNYS